MASCRELAKSRCNGSTIVLWIVLQSLSIAIAVSVGQYTTPCQEIVSGYSKLITCADLGERDSFSVVRNSSSISYYHYSSLSFPGRTKIRAIQSGVVSGLSIGDLKMDNLGIRTVSSGAFSNLRGVSSIDLSRNNIRSVDSGVFEYMTSSALSLNMSQNDIENFSSSALRPIASSLTSLDLSDNRMPYLSNETFAEMTSLEDLDLSSNLLTSISGSLFRNLTSVTSLSLGNNRISFVDQAAFVMMTSLTTLGLENNNIASLPDGLFTGLPLLQAIRLDYNRLTHIDAGFLDGVVSTGLSLTISWNRLDDLGRVVLNHTAASAIQSLSLASNRIATIPDCYFRSLTSVDSLDLSWNNIETMDTLTLDGLGSLLTLNLADNKINLLDVDAFSPVRLLRSLTLSNNALDSVIPGTFSGLSALQSLSLNGNSITKIDSGLFQNLTSLSDLDLSDNHIASLGVGSFDVLPQLRWLNLSGNNVENVPVEAFLGVPYMTYVDLNRNQLTAVPVELYRSFPFISDVSIEDNNITELDMPRLGRNLSTSLRGNRIWMIRPGSFNETTSLNLGGNLLTHVAADMFAGATRLTVLDVSDNAISKLDVGCFKSLSLVVTLRLDGNAISTLPVGTFAGLTNLQVLNLASNRLVEMTYTVFLGLQQLTKLYIDDNNITTVGLARFQGNISSLQKLTLCRNQIKSRLYNISAFAPNLRYLDAGNNELTDDVYDDIRPLTDLRSLKLDGNQISRIPNNYTNLRELDLSSNSLTDSSLPALASLINLTSLTLDNNGLSTLSTFDWNVLSDRLVTLSIDSNQLTDFGSEIPKLVRLRTLRMRFNEITSIPDHVFREMYDLEYVWLRGNQLTIIGPDSLDGLEQRCSELELIENQIGSVDPEAFRRLKHLRVLYLQRNSIGSLVLPPIMNSLEVLNLGDNQLTRFPDGLRRANSIRILYSCRNLIAALPELEFHDAEIVDFSDNVLSDVGAVTLSGSFELVSFSNNRLNEGGITSTDFLGGAKRIADLDLSKNGLTTIPSTICQATSSIERLRLTGNKLTTVCDWQTPELPISVVELLLDQNALVDFPTSTLNIGSLQLLDLRANFLTGLSEFSFEGTDGSTRTLLLSGNPWRCDCQLAWLRRLPVDVDNATCVSPLSVAGRPVVCYNVSGCQQFNGTDQCSDFKEPTGCWHNWQRPSG